MDTGPEPNNATMARKHKSSGHRKTMISLFLGLLEARAHETPPFILFSKSGRLFFLGWDFAQHCLEWLPL